MNKAIEDIFETHEAIARQMPNIDIPAWSYCQANAEHRHSGMVDVYVI
jgi:hypothetical protein